MLALILLSAGQLGAAVDFTGSQPGIATLAAMAAAALLLTLAVALRTVPLPACGALTSAAVRQRSERTAFLSLCAPDAAGRPRPRAPSVRPRAA